MKPPEADSDATLNTIVKLINAFGGGQHVEANRGNLMFFTKDYIDNCVRLALASGRISEVEMAICKRWLNPGWEPPLKKPKILKHDWK